MRGGHRGCDNSFKYWTKAKHCLSNFDCDDGNQCAIDTCGTNGKECRHELSFDECRTAGKPTALATRMKALDGETTMSAEEIKDAIFGASDAAFSVKSQFNLCSCGKFYPVSYSGKSNHYAAIADEVAEVSLVQDITGEEAGSIEGTILAAANEKHGDLKSQVDLLLLFMSAGTQLAGTNDWKVRAFIDYWLSVHNDKHASFLAMVMHELSHDLGLLHSNDEFSYGDGTRLIGALPTKADSPHMCYNSAKSWQLRWCDDSNLILNAEEINDDIHQLVTTSEHNLIASLDNHATIKLVKCTDKYDHCINFNRKLDITTDNS